MRRWTHITFSLIWLAYVFIFGVLAYEAYKSKNTTLTRFDFRIPKEFQVQVGTVRFQNVINGLAEAHDRNVSLLEASIRKTAETMFYLNCISCFFSLCGFIAQVVECYYERGSRQQPPGKDERNQDECIATKDTSRSVNNQTQTGNVKTV